MITERVDRAIPLDALGALAEQLAALIGEGFGGCSGSIGADAYLDVRLPDDASETLKQRVRQLVMDFDLSNRTAEQLHFQEVNRIAEAGRARYTAADMDSDLLRYLWAEIELLRLKTQ